ncbi:cysteine desulfurase NifS [uncultured Methanobrevibacter sp.]|uniref:cysteine desulfurase NifS n=1 Tax=uncultured Methanobrevibacter sp. TaxID=253161 RepID=UPI0025D851B5|nr:cysteine desulfurase NifS [uncultured Methanobrevibacter sp.]MCI6995087.1 cysteine desulfurase NifS [Methanobrevibacter sp.]
MYLDNSATTQVSQEVFEEMKPYFVDVYGNPSTLYKIGRESKKALDLARQRVADAINAKPEEIYFTSGGSESDNLAIKGIAFKLAKKGKHIITTEIEHPAVKRTTQFLESLDFKVTYLPVYENGIIKIEDLKEAITDETILISIMHGNNELGTIQPIEEIGKIAREKGIKFHTDAVQTFGKIEVDVEKLNVDLLALSSHKINGPKGVGALYIRKGTRVEPLIHGGGQEKGIRSGTENVPGIVGFGKACELAATQLDEHYEKLISIRNEISEKILNTIPEAYLNGDAEKRLPNLLNFRFKAIEGESLILLLDAKGYQASTGSACSSNTLEASPVLTALGLDPVDVHGSLRISLAPESDNFDVDEFVNTVAEAVARLREMSPLWNQEIDYDGVMCKKGNKDSCKRC